ncbi:uncharacterized protein ARMOST_05596 [Armillaria ostoyae]|uniref:HIT-type domain-containing protein n=1 Tax=Armillaria ostoyae TaxID=47428 RepID=A0A284R0L2_ARMOS|nr:uncharacterized protein ARMOST_05596 [Armillaria ostoyae]
MSTDLQHYLQAGAFLLESPSSTASSSSLQSTLKSRIAQYYDYLQQPQNFDDNASMEEIKQVTAEEALSVVGCVQRIIGGQGSEDDVPLIGTRDIAQLRTLLSIVFKWGVEPLLSRILVALPTPSTSKKVQIATENTLKDYEHLCKLINEIFILLFPSGVQSRLPQTLITTTVLSRHVTDVLKPAIVLGWLPKYLITEHILPLESVRPLVIRLLSILHPSQSITALGGAISSLSPGPVFALRTCSMLLSKQVMRTQGVNGLCAAVFGDSEEAGEEVHLDKLEHVAKVLTAVPKGMDPKDYYRAIVPRIIMLLYNEAPASYKRAAAFTISRMLATDGSSSHHEAARGIIMPLLHGPLLHVSTLSEPNSLVQPISPLSQPGPSVSSSELNPNTALTALSTLITNTDPVPTLIATLLSPVISSLYSLLEHLEHVRTSDPTTRETVRSMLETWGRVVEKDEGTRIIWNIVRNEGSDTGWKVDLEGRIYQVDKEKKSGLAVFTPEDLEKAELAGELDPDANIMDLYPDPQQFVSFLKKIDRRDVSGELFVKLLEAYRDSRVDGDPMKTLLYLQLIMQIQTKMSDGDGKGNILKEPGHILVFVKHALEARDQPNPVFEKTKDPLRFIHTEEDLGEEDSDDENTPEYDEMTETSVNLLLSILEANPDLSARTEPVLNEIFELLEPLAKTGPEGIKPIAREARMVITARLASTSTAIPYTGRTKDDAEEVRETYQRALKLLQDPILPVRAHGLLLLRELAKGGKMEEALIPAVLAIFLQALQDEDSYVYLNGVQGLAGMVEGGRWGREVLRGLVGDYAKGTSGGYVWSRGEVDTRVRIGEALGMVIRRCGSALGAYVDIIVPTLLRIVRTREIPTTLRTSAISLLGECAATHALALASYFQDLVGGMIDLLQLESVQTEEEDREKSMDENPTKADGKFPPMRRAAVRFLGVLVREATKAIYNNEDVGYERRIWQVDVLRRAKVTLGYLAATDGDGVVRVMAREVGEQLQQLEEAFVEVVRSRKKFKTRLPPTMASVASSSTAKICPVCNAKPTKYTCPGCETPTCSLPCSKAHKERTRCTGQRNKVKYIPMNRYGWGEMMSDYTYLEDVGRKTGEWSKDGSGYGGWKGKGKSRGGKREALQIHLETLGITMELLPMELISGASRTQTVYLTIEVKKHTSSTTHSTILTHRHKLNTVLSDIIDVHPSSWCVLRGQNESVDRSKTLEEILKGATFVEYPTFDVWEEKPKRMAVGALKGILGEYGSEDEGESTKKITQEGGMAALGDYDSSSSEGSDEGSEAEVDWGDSEVDEETVP